MTSKHKCSKKIWPGRSAGCYCSRPATVERDGKWYCWQHNPEHVKAKAIKRMTTWQSEQNRLDAMYIRNARLGPLVTEELAALLEKLADAMDKYRALGFSQITYSARVTAACIREALALEGDDD